LLETETKSKRAESEAISPAADKKGVYIIRWQPPSTLMAFARLLGIVLWIAASSVRSTAQNLIAGGLNVGFSDRAFSGINRSDAEAAFKAYLVSVGRQLGYDLVTHMEMFKSASDFEAAIRGGKLQLSIIPAWDYLTMDIQDFADPYFVAMKEEGILQSYILLTQRSSGFRSFADLRGKSVAVLESTEAYLSMKWMETALLEEKLGRPETFFGRVDKVSKASAAVLPVFFGKYDACVVNRPAFDVMIELNPQVGERLQPVAVSEPLLGAVICLSKSGWISAKHREDTKQALADLNSGLAGQQILTLFRVQKMAPFKPDYLETLRRLKAEHDLLATQAAHARQDR
jgi:phosphonate transport system substrate-binding protein